MSRKSLVYQVVKFAPLLALLGAPSEAEACGGLFCSTTPVDQNAEAVAEELAKWVS